MSLLKLSACKRELNRATSALPASSYWDGPYGERERITNFSASLLSSLSISIQNSSKILSNSEPVKSPSLFVNSLSNQLSLSGRLSENLYN